MSDKLDLDALKTVLAQMTPIPWSWEPGPWDSDRMTLANAVPALIVEVERLRAERDEARAQLGGANGVLTMTVARLGGIVEGNPTGRHNFLQRIDELVSMEAKLIAWTRKQEAQR